MGRITPIPFGGMGRRWDVAKRLARRPWVTIATENPYTRELLNGLEEWFREPSELSAGRAADAASRCRFYIADWGTGGSPELGALVERLTGFEAEARAFAAGRGDDAAVSEEVRALVEQLGRLAR